MNNKIISIQGIKGSFHHIVADKLYGDKIKLLERDTFDEVFADVEESRADLAIAAIENSIAGSILANYDLLNKHNLHIVGEAYLRIKHNLMALPDTKLSDVSTVYSHPMAIKQCLEYLDKHAAMKRIQTEDTAGSAKMIRDKNLKNAAAIAGSLAAKIYGMKILASGIETNKQNFTRFMVISRTTNGISDQNKMSIVFQAAHKPGSLHNCLGVFAKRNMNLTKIQSRPIIGSKNWEYYFYVDVEDNDLLTKKDEVLDELQKYTSMQKVLGIYKSGEYLETD
jgi:prephenate dehydratase